MDEWFHPSDRAIEAPGKFFFAEHIYSLFPRESRPKFWNCFWTFCSHHPKIATSYLFAIKLSHGSLPEVDAVMTEVERRDRVSSVDAEMPVSSAFAIHRKWGFPFPRM